MIDDFDINITPEELEDEFEDGWIEFEPGKMIWDEMAANP